MKLGLKLMGLVLVVIGAVVAVRAIPSASNVSDGTTSSATIYLLDVEREKIAETMSEAVRIPTISFGRDKPTSGEALLAFQQFLRDTFPRVFETLTVEVVGDYSLLLHWKGSDAAAGKPVLILGHIDVVPVIPGTEDEWEYPPFSGYNDGTYIWGRGTLDDKLNVIASLHAVDMLLADGRHPKRDIYFAFGHDEEQGGLDGAGAIGDLLQSRGIEAEFLIDEGGAVVEGMVPGLSKPVAIIAPAEKGIVTLELVARGEGGHSSMPPKQSSIGILSQAITRLEQKPFPDNFTQTRAFLEALAPELPYAQRLIMNNLWLFGPLVKWQMAQDPQGNAGLRTTTAVTVINGGVKANVLPISATALVNFRIFPGETPDTVRARVIEIINDDRITVSFSESGQTGMAPSPTAPLSGFGWQHLTQVIRDVAAPGDIVIAPRLLVAATDTRHYREITPNQYRFTWLRAQPGDLKRIHGTNERIGVADLADAVRFYHRFLNDL